MSVLRPHLGWYVGDGAGARARLLALRPHLGSARLSVLADGSPLGLDDRDVATVDLPWEPPGVRFDGGDAVLGEASPLGARVRRWLQQDRPDLVVIDGVTPVATVVASAGVPVVRVRRPGDLPPRRGTSVGELAPYPAALEPPATPRWVLQRTVHAGLLSRFAGRCPDRRAGRHALGIPLDAPVVTVLCGRDGLAPAGLLAAAARATPGWTWVTVGRCGTPADGVPANLLRLGWTLDPWSALEAADVVISSGSLAVVAEVSSARRPLVVVPRSDRFGDEVVARVLTANEAVTALPTWPAAGAWAAVLADARLRDAAALQRLEDAQGPARAAERLLAWAVPAPRPGGDAIGSSREHRRSRSVPGHVLDLAELERRRQVAEA